MNTYLIHHGIKGMKWGVRRYQNDDGTLTDKGKRRNESRSRKNSAIKKAIIAGSVLAGTALVAYGGYKYNQHINNENTLAAMHIGQVFGARFGTELASSVHGTGHDWAMKNLTRNVGQTAGRQAGNDIAPKIAENIYKSHSGFKKMDLYKGAKAIKSGKKTPYDVVDYASTVRKILEDEDVVGNGQSMLAKHVRDALAYLGSLPIDLQYWRK